MGTLNVSRSGPARRRWTQDETTDDRRVHPRHLAELADLYGPFTLDVAAADHNAVCDRWFTLDTDGLAQSWAGERVWCNPPYSDIAPWLAKAWDEHRTATAITMLLPASRTEQGWWHRYVEPHRDQAGSPLTTRFLPGRMHFLRPGQTAIAPGERPPFGCVALHWAASPYAGDVVTGGLFGGDRQ